MSRKTAAITKSKAPRKPTAPAEIVAVRVPAPGEGKRGEQGYLGYLLRQAHAAVRLTMERTLADLGVTSPQFAVLTMLNAYPGLSGADVARLTFLTPQTVGVIIRNLDRDGAIAMTPHPVHGRIQQWTLTQRGTTLLKACRERVIALEKRLAASLDAKAETAIRRWLAGIAADLQED
ncbi:MULTISPECIES: MarR family winged helix-turn-helix transcriptional regulator [Bradyrhizobium]|jgi:DNA-binding MarR family transcriptional regulator|uniref:MarR family transcriptional regulator n=2 Tax=Bradyrhizobium TaxID=374 RepID=A0A1Y2JN92_BRAJP|nr:MULTISPECIES: MarR family transcriptional regulator [Bradyrhizobium]OSJ32367.1 MarR family transcriptional regulator [Bradyrhizobium japonicum]UPT83908.1 MarR family transcriptional regulator [Bradyrhizobium barranii subsp. apii]UPT93041.1 MarR family transcriptional regulator [Bradyrhizobium barranii subsp. apii]